MWEIDLSCSEIGFLRSKYGPADTSGYGEFNADWYVGFLLGWDLRLTPLPPHTELITSLMTEYLDLGLLLKYQLLLSSAVAKMYLKANQKLGSNRPKAPEKKQ